jgi:excisionase family DNA binding protein
MGDLSDRRYETLLTREEVADILRCSTQTVRRLEERGKIPRVELSGIGIRYRPSSINEYIEKQEFFRPKRKK